jgi:LysR family transcriptional regulator, glycine cleavage system transcriptional activator
VRPPLPPLRLLTVFETVLRRGGTRAAAEELNVSQPAVSQALRQLEEHLGAPLLDRGTRPAGLTEAGRLLHRAVVEGLGKIAEAIEDIRRLAESADRAVTIACSVGFATYWLMPRLSQLYARHPDLAVNVRTTQRGDPTLSAGIDIATRYGAGDWTDGEVRLLFHERVDPVCSPAYAARLRQAGHGLEAAALIHVDDEDERWTPWRAYLKAVGLPARGRRHGIRFTNYVQATQAALHGQGVMLGWRSITADLVRDGRLVHAIERPLIPRDAYYLVLARKPRAPAACAAVAEWLHREAEAQSGAA